MPHPAALNCSGDEQGPLRQAHPEPVDDLIARGLRVGGDAEGDEERRVVLNGRVRVRHARGLVAEGRELVDIAAGQRIAGPGVEIGRPTGRLCVDAPIGQEGQTVGEESRPDDQDALVTQLLQPPAELYPFPLARPARLRRFRQSRLPGCRYV